MMKMTSSSLCRITAVFIEAKRMTRLVGVSVYVHAYNRAMQGRAFGWNQSLFEKIILRQQERNIFFITGMIQIHKKLLKQRL